MPHHVGALGAARVPSVGDLVPALELVRQQCDGGVRRRRNGGRGAESCLPSWYGRPRVPFGDEILGVPLRVDGSLARPLPARGRADGSRAETGAARWCPVSS